MSAIAALGAQAATAGGARGVQSWSARRPAPFRRSCCGASAPDRARCARPRRPPRRNGPAPGPARAGPCRATAGAPAVRRGRESARRGSVLLRGQLHGEGIQRAEGRHLLIASQREQPQQIPGQRLLARVHRDRIEGAAPGGGRALGQRRAAPAAGGGGRDPVLQMSAQPGAHHLRRDRVAAEALGPFIGPGAHARVDARLARLPGQLEGLSEALAAHQAAALRVEEHALPVRQSRADADVLEVLRVGDQIGAGGRAQAPAGRQKTSPRTYEIVFMKARTSEQILAIEQGAGTDVDRQGLHLTPRVDARAPGKAGDLGLVERALKGARDKSSSPAESRNLPMKSMSQRDQVGQCRAGRQGRGHGGVVVLVGQRHDVDLHARMQPREARQRELERAIQVGVARDGDPHGCGFGRARDGRAGQQRQGFSAPQRSHFFSCRRRRGSSAAQPCLSGLKSNSCSLHAQESPCQRCQTGNRTSRGKTLRDAAPTVSSAPRNRYHPADPTIVRRPWRPQLHGIECFEPALPRARPEPATVQDVARLAGVSPATVVAHPDGLGPRRRGQAACGGSRHPETEVPAQSVGARTAQRLDAHHRRADAGTGEPLLRQRGQGRGPGADRQRLRAHRRARALDPEEEAERVALLTARKVDGLIVLGAG
ncbi:hypothetical protein Ddc_22836 [Ditylenchus destructor]|nr:hypothetical protein Ddc_22836 [Ditylenchus destructor]